MEFVPFLTKSLTIPNGFWNNWIILIATDASVLMISSAISGAAGDTVTGSGWKLENSSHFRREEGKKTNWDSLQITKSQSKQPSSLPSIDFQILYCMKPSGFPLLFGFSEIWGNWTAVSPRMLKVAPQTNNRPQDKTHLLSLGPTVTTPVKIVKHKLRGQQVSMTKRSEKR